MALFTKTVLNLNMVGDKNLQTLEQDCLEHFGNGLYQTEMERLEHNSDFSGLISSFNYKEGNQMSINTECICYEKRINLLDTKYKPQLYIIAMAYMDAELGKHVSSRETEYINFIKKVFSSCSIKYIEIKIFKVGNIEYYCYTI